MYYRFLPHALVNCEHLLGRFVRYGKNKHFLAQGGLKDAYIYVVSLDFGVTPEKQKPTFRSHRNMSMKMRHVC